MEHKILDDRILKEIPKRKPFAHKGTYGRILIIAGSVGMSGAAYLCALSAYRSGVGLIYIFTAKENREILQTSIPEAIVIPYDKDDFDEDILSEHIAKADLIILGPGIGTDEVAQELVETVLSESYVPMIVDADAINIIAQNPHLQRYYTENIILTPHIKEMARLIGQTVEYVQENMMEVACQYHEEYGVGIILKSHQTVIVGRDDVVYLHNIATPALAKAGSGDILTGILAGMLCIGADEEKALALAVYIHARAAKISAKKLGDHGVIARDIIANIPMAMQYNEE